MDRATKKAIQEPNDKLAIAEGCTFDTLAGQRVIEFIERFCKHSKGQFAGQPFLLLPWQKTLLTRLFSWKRADGTRRFRVAYIGVSKKQGKSCMVSAISLYLLVADNESGAAVASVANTRKQASIVFDEAANMVRQNSQLSQRIDINETIKRLSFKDKLSNYHVFSNDAPGADGQNLSAVLFDELHRQPNRKLWDVLKYSGSARRQPLIISITTAGSDQQSICYEQYKYAKDVQSGLISDTAFFTFIAEASAADDIRDPKTWHKANPSLGVTQSIEDFAKDFNEAINVPAKENTFRQLRLNQWTEIDRRWLSLTKWDECTSPFDIEELKGKPCVAGLDLSSTQDVTAFVLFFPCDPKKGKPHIVLPFFWLPEDIAKARALKGFNSLQTWNKQGHLYLTDGDTVDYDFIRHKINELGDIYDIQQIDCDPWNCTQLATQLIGDGFCVNNVRQGYQSMNEPMKELERMILSKELNHLANPVLRWMSSNVVIDTDPVGNIKPNKEKGSEKIDGIVALVMAIGRKIHTIESTDSYYETTGIDFF